jgi:hypothetical protein
MSLQLRYSAKVRFPIFGCSVPRGPQGLSVNADRSTIKFPVLQRLTASGNESDYANRTDPEKYQKGSESDGYRRYTEEASDLVRDHNPG